MSDLRAAIREAEEALVEGRECASDHDAECLCGPYAIEEALRSLLAAAREAEAERDRYREALREILAKPSCTCSEDWKGRRDPRCAGRIARAALSAAAPAEPVSAAYTLPEAARQALAVLTEIADSAAYWSDYDVPLGIVSRVDEAKARLTAALSAAPKAAAKGGKP